VRETPDAAFYTGAMPEMELWPTVRLLSTAARLLEHAWNERLRSLGLTHAGVIALDVLAAKGPMTQAMLADMVSVQAQTIGKTLARLESSGYIDRRANPSDRRSHEVSITAAGDAVRESTRDLEVSVLASRNVDTDTLRKELQILVRELAATNKAGLTVLDAGMSASSSVDGVSSP
jgi:MarR family transcriptional regulator, organic hydroperoxide resistance regulator